MNRLFADIETSPNIGLFWRAGYKQNISYDNIIQERGIICIGYKWENAKKAECLQWDENQDDREMLEKFTNILAEADEVVFHNGDRFDLPWIRSRALMHEIPAWPEPKSVDTLQWARRRFYFNSNRLDYLGEILTGAGKLKTEYGMWKDILLRKCPKAMAKMVKYCKQDVVKLQEVYEKLAAYVPAKTHVSVLNGGEKWMSPFAANCTDVFFNKTYVTAAGTLKHYMRCNATNRIYTISDRAYQDYREWRLDNPYQRKSA